MAAQADPAAFASGAGSAGGGSRQSDMLEVRHVDGGAAAMTRKASVPAGVAPVLSLRDAGEDILLPFEEPPDSVSGPRRDFAVQPHLPESQDGATGSAVQFDSVALTDLPRVGGPRIGDDEAVAPPLA